jgi:small subunit ribosomal protein S5
VVESAGVKDILTKSLGSRNPHNAVKATVVALRQLRDIHQTATKRGKRPEDLTDPSHKAAPAAQG